MRKSSETTEDTLLLPYKAYYVQPHKLMVLFSFQALLLLLPSFLPDCQPNKMWNMSFNSQIYGCLLMVAFLNSCIFFDFRKWIGKFVLLWVK